MYQVIATIVGENRIEEAPVGAAFNADSLQMAWVVFNDNQGLTRVLASLFGGVHLVCVRIEKVDSNA